jgi:hypothetical protein
MHRVVGEVHRGDIVAEDDVGLVDDDIEFHKQISQPVALGGDIGYSLVFCLYGRTRHHSLSFG